MELNHSYSLILSFQQASLQHHRERVRGVGCGAADGAGDQQAGPPEAHPAITGLYPSDAR